MPAFPVLQPDGRLAIFSTVVEHFVAFDASVEEAVIEISERHRGPIEWAVREVAAGRLPYDHFDTWTDCVSRAIFRHGDDDETVQMALDRSMSVQDEIYQRVRNMRTEEG